MTNTVDASKQFVIKRRDEDFPFEGTMIECALWIMNECNMKLRVEECEDSEEYYYSIVDADGDVFYDDYGDSPDDVAARKSVMQQLFDDHCEHEDFLVAPSHTPQAFALQGEYCAVLEHSTAREIFENDLDVNDPDEVRAWYFDSL